MDGSFACPECGSEVEVEGLAPGRQVRCGFCDRLLEVPYLPRAPVATWKRRRFERAAWVRWAWMAVAVVAVTGVAIGGFRFFRRQYRSAREGSIKKLLDSSRDNEQAGRLDLALIDLDAALDLARRSGPSVHLPIEQAEKRRTDLARREAQSSLDSLVRHGPQSFPLGEWLNLLARARKDPDLRALAPAFEEEFRGVVQRQATFELGSARRSFDSGQVVASLQACDRIARLLPHLPPGIGAEVRSETEALVERLVATHGVALETQRGDFVLGSFETYRATLTPLLVKALEAKGYLPYRESSPWRSAWQKAMYHMRLEVSERREGNYLSTENRLTRIEARLTLSTSRKLVWQTIPTARTIVPLPNLPVYLSSRLAAQPERSQECERLLYENARGQIDEKFGYALSNMPACCQ
jgi:hypothetical protein